MKWYKTIWGKIIIAILIVLFLLTGFSIFSLIFSLWSINKLKTQLEQPRVVIRDDIQDLSDSDDLDDEDSKSTEKQQIHKSKKDVDLTEQAQQTHQVEQHIHENIEQMESIKKDTNYLLNRFRNNEETLNKQISARNELLNDFKECAIKTNELEEKTNKFQLNIDDFSNNLFEEFKQTSNEIKKQVNDEIKEQMDKQIMENKFQSNIAIKHVDDEINKIKVFSNSIHKTMNKNRETIDQMNNRHNNWLEKTNQTIYNITEKVRELEGKIKPIQKSWEEKEDKINDLEDLFK